MARWVMSGWVGHGGGEGSTAVQLIQFCSITQVDWSRALHSFICLTRRLLLGGAQHASSLPNMHHHPPGPLAERE